MGGERSHVSTIGRKAAAEYYVGRAGEPPVSVEGPGACFDTWMRAIRLARRTLFLAGPRLWWPMEPGQEMPECPVQT